MLARIVAAVCCLTALPILAGAASETGDARAPHDILFPYEWIGNIDELDLREPSGVTYHPGRGTVFAVGDNGDMCEIETDGTPVQQKELRPADLEGITVVPATGLLYVAVEGAERILEVDPDGLRIRREFAIERELDGNVVLAAGGQGIEGLAFVPDVSHPQGGTFFVANQSFDLDDTDDVSGIFQVELPLRDTERGPLQGRILQHFAIGVIDLSGLHYDSARDRLLIISDATNTLFETTRSGGILRSYAFPGENQEGITLDREGHIYIAQDSGGIIKLRWIREE